MPDPPVLVASSVFNRRTGEAVHGDLERAAGERHTRALGMLNKRQNEERRRGVAAACSLTPTAVQEAKVLGREAH